MARHGADHDEITVSISNLHAAGQWFTPGIFIPPDLQRPPAGGAWSPVGIALARWVPPMFQRAPAVASRSPA